MFRSHTRTNLQTFQTMKRHWTCMDGDIVRPPPNKRLCVPNEELKKK